jgi:hypothetical protein
LSVKLARYAFGEKLLEDFVDDDDDDEEVNGEPNKSL